MGSACTTETSSIHLEKIGKGEKVEIAIPYRGSPPGEVLHVSSPCACGYASRGSRGSASDM